MNKRTPSVEWTIAESEAEWERLQAPPLFGRETVTNRRRFLTRYYWSVAALFLLLVGVGGWAWHTTQAAMQQVAADETATTQQELEEVAQHDNRLAAISPSGPRGIEWYDSSDWRVVLQTEQPTAHLRSTVQAVEVQGSQAVARILTTAQDGVPLYRQTRFYRRTSTAWVQTVPDAALWGVERSLETSSFAFHFRQNDAQAVIAVAPQVEALYTTLRQNFGLPLTPDAEKLVIDVSVTQSPENALFQPHGYERFVMANRLVVASPALYLAPVELTDADLLAQSIALPLLDQVLAQANEQHAVRANWQLLLRGLYLWQVWDLDLPLAAWRKDVVKWLYVDLPGAGPGQSVVLPEQYPALCATHRLWMLSPMQLNIPLICAEPKWENINLSSWSAREPLTRLEQFGLPLPNADPSTESISQGRTIALAVLIEYAMATYGRERLPALVAGLGQYDSWETLIPAVYGVSAAEFEMGWQVYLKAHYGIISAH